MTTLRSPVVMALGLFPLLLVSGSTSTHKASAAGLVVLNEPEAQPPSQGNTGTPGPDAVGTSSRSTQSGQSLSPKEIFERAHKGVVLLETRSTAGSAGQGSGFLIDDRGHVVTNFHVIQDACVIQVSLGEEVATSVRVVFVDPIQDVAVLRVEGLTATALSLGSLEDIGAGSRVVAIGYPQAARVGRSATISDGIYSGITEIGEGRSMMRITAPISPGSSGGPLFDEAGAVVGITTSTLPYLYTGAQNINFAVPIDVVRRVDRNKDARPPSETCRDYVVHALPYEEAVDPRDDRVALEHFKRLAAAIVAAVRQGAMAMESDRAPRTVPATEQAIYLGSIGTRLGEEQKVIPSRTYEYKLRWYTTTGDYAYNVYGVDPKDSVVTTFMGYVRIPVQMYSKKVVVESPKDGSCDGSFYAECVSQGSTVTKEKKVRGYETISVWALSYQEGRWQVRRVLGPALATTFLRLVSRADQQGIYRTIIGTE